MSLSLGIPIYSIESVVRMQIPFLISSLTLNATLRSASATFVAPFAKGGIATYDVRYKPTTSGTYTTTSVVATVPPGANKSTGGWNVVVPLTNLQFGTNYNFEIAPRNAKGSPGYTTGTRVTTPINLNYLVVAGGATTQAATSGAGGYRTTVGNQGGGSGAATVISDVAQSNSITATVGGAGSNSSLAVTGKSTIESFRGGNASQIGGSGGSSAAGTSGQGYAGGNQGGQGHSCHSCGQAPDSGDHGCAHGAGGPGGQGGGGGAGSVGGNGGTGGGGHCCPACWSPNFPGYWWIGSTGGTGSQGNAGSGISGSITGSSVTRAAGGNAGGANTGNPGQGGVVIVTHPETVTGESVPLAAGNYTTRTTSGGNVIYVFNSSGNVGWS